MQDGQYVNAIVSFIDILGFQQMLATKPASDIRAIMLKLRDFSDPTDEREFAEKAGVDISRAYSENISDAIVRARVYETKERDGALANELMDLRLIQQDMINRGVLLRGGVTLGEIHLGANGKGPVFGPALARAYKLESEVARHPRIVVDQCVLDEMQRPASALKSFENAPEWETRYIFDLLRLESDGSYSIDYLSGISFDGDVCDVTAFLDQHAQTVRSVPHDQTASSTYLKFSWLRKYHNDRLDELVDWARQTPEFCGAIEEATELTAEGFADEVRVM